jgi:CheY-like chemotaxis protein
MKTRVLHAEDEQLVRAFIDEALHFLGFEVVGVADGDAALARLSRESFDVVITDHHMPKTGGLELVRELRARGFGGRIYVLSGALHAHEHREYEALGVDGIAAKPLGLMELSLFLKNAMIAPAAPGRTWARLPDVAHRGA